MKTPRHSPLEGDALDEHAERILHRAENLRFYRPQQHRLKGFFRHGDVQAVLGRQHPVEGLVLQRLAADAGETGAGQKVGLQQHGFAVCQAQTHDAVDGAALRQGKGGGQRAGGRHFHKIHDARLGRFAQPAHVFVKAVDGAELLANLRPGDEGTLALDAVDIPFLRQLLQSLPHGGAAYFVGFAQFRSEGSRLPSA